MKYLGPLGGAESFLVYNESMSKLVRRGFKKGGRHWSQTVRLIKNYIEKKDVKTNKSISACLRPQWRGKTLFSSASQLLSVAPPSRKN